MKNELFEKFKKELLKIESIEDDWCFIEDSQSLDDYEYAEFFWENVETLDFKVVGTGRKGQYELYALYDETAHKYAEREWYYYYFLGMDTDFDLCVNSKMELITKEEFKNAVDDEYYIRNSINKFSKETGVPKHCITVHRDENNDRYYYFKVEWRNHQYTCTDLDASEHRLKIEKKWKNYEN